MANLTLGLDIGPNSIGWSLVDQEVGKIHASGVRVFPEGVDRDQQGGEKSKSQSRRDARAIRRQIQRRVRRRQLLRHELGASRLLPQDSESLEKLLARNPYQLRDCAVNGKISLHELGRIILHLGQRRGYKSNRKADKKEDSKKGGILDEMNELAGKIGEGTLGSYFARCDAHYDRSDRLPRKDISADGIRKGKCTSTNSKKSGKNSKSIIPEILTDELKYGKRGKQAFPKSRKRSGQCHPRHLRNTEFTDCFSFSEKSIGQNRWWAVANWSRVKNVVREPRESPNDSAWCRRSTISCSWIG